MIGRFIASLPGACSRCSRPIPVGGDVYYDGRDDSVRTGSCCVSLRPLKIGSLFTGYGGLDMAAEAAFDATTAWVSDIDKGACKLLAHRYPGVPNLGDITAIDWSTVEPVDIITGGSPCQDLSHAGRRAGMTEGTRSNLWVAMREAIARMRPAYVIWENVRGAFSAAADSAVESCPGCVGDGSGVHLRALGRVLGDLSDLGYDTQWRGLRAADVGAPHGRFRVFVVARLADDEGKRLQGPGPESKRCRPERSGGVTALGYLDRVASMTADPVLLDRIERQRAKLLPSPRTSDTNGAGQHGEGGPDLRTAVASMTRLTGANDESGTSFPPDGADDAPNQSKGRDVGGPAPVTLLPTPVVTDSAGTRNATAGWSNPDSKHHAGTTLTDALLPTPMVGSTLPAAHGQISGDFRARMDDAISRFGQYAPAIARWEAVTGLPAPAPTEPTGRGGAHRLSPRFTEWMMGLPAGWITDVPDIARNEALKLCGNGVVQQQAFAAITDCLRVEAAMAA